MFKWGLWNLNGYRVRFVKKVFPKIPGRCYPSLENFLSLASEMLSQTAVWFFSGAIERFETNSIICLCYLCLRVQDSLCLRAYDWSNIVGDILCPPVRFHHQAIADLSKNKVSLLVVLFTLWFLNPCSLTRHLLLHYCSAHSPLS